MRCDASQRISRRLEGLSAIDDAWRLIHARPQPVQNGSKVPRIGPMPVERRLGS
jgi:hypothetical protein